MRAKESSHPSQICGVSLTNSTRVFYGWWVVATAALALCLGAGPRVEPEQSARDGLSWRETWHSSTFWLLISSFFLAGASVHACVLHMPALLMDRGVSAHGAAMASSIVGIALLIGRVGTGYLLDRFCSPACGFLFLRSVGRNRFATVRCRRESCARSSISGRARDGSRGRHHCIFAEPLFWVEGIWNCVWLCVWSVCARGRSWDVADGRGVRFHKGVYRAAGGIFRRDVSGGVADDEGWALSLCSAKGSRGA